MATNEFPTRNINYPMDPKAVERARARLDPGQFAAQFTVAPADGKGSRREVRQGEWVDDRVIKMGGPSSPSEDSPPEIDLKATPKAIPTFVAGKVYSVTLGKACTFAGRVLSPAADYTMTGETCNDPVVKPCITDAVLLGDTPQDPNIAPSLAISQEDDDEDDTEKKQPTKKRR
jgi:hypothetical protein